MVRTLASLIGMAMDSKAMLYSRDREGQWQVNLHLDGRVKTVIVPDASHALYPQ
jgi:hypothetical protein